jgi:F0F1-type ATP synthase assembly protein I
MNFEKKNRWAVYLAVLGLIGLILSGLAYIPLSNEDTGFQPCLFSLEKASSPPNRPLLFVGSETSSNQKMLRCNPSPFIGEGYRANSHFGVAFLEGYGIVFLVEAFFVLKIFLGGMKNSSRFLTKFFRAEMQKIVLFILLIAFLLRYSRPDFFGLLLGLIFALILSRLLMII